MKWIVLWLLFFTGMTTVYGQPICLALSSDQTVTLQFEGSIRHIDRGTSDLLLQAVPGAPQMVLIKGACAGFAPTTLTIITQSDSVYTFLVHYERVLTRWLYRFGTATTASRSFRHMLRDRAPVQGRPSVAGDGLRLRLTGVYLTRDGVFLQLALDNEGPLDFSAAFWQCTLRDRKRGRRRASEERVLALLPPLDPPLTLPAYSGQKVLLALPRFSLRRDQELVIDLMEKDGGRSLQLRLHTGQWRKGVPLDDQGVPINHH